MQNAIHTSICTDWPLRQFARIRKDRYVLPQTADLITGTTLVQSFYVSQGFPKVQIVKLSTIPDNNTGTVNAIVTINEGPRFFFGPISFAKNFGIAKTDFSAKIKSLTDPPKPYSDADSHAVAVVNTLVAVHVDLVVKVARRRRGE